MKMYGRIVRVCPQKHIVEEWRFYANSEVRRVPSGWEHPKNEQGHHIPLFDGSFSKRAARWDEEVAQWEKGFRRSFMDEKWEPKTAKMTGIFADWVGDRPDEKNYMPDWSDIERTHYQMYESITEGTPISPVMESPEALAQWLTDNKTLFAYATATYNQWLAMIKAGVRQSAASRSTSPLAKP